MANEVMLTTFDNPYDPFNQFTSWLMFDVEKGYNTCSRLARFTQDSDILSDQEALDDIELAMDRLLSCDFLNIYRRVYKNNDGSKEI